MPFEQLESIVLPPPPPAPQSPPPQEPADVIRSEDLFLPPLDDNDNPSWLDAPPRLSEDVPPSDASRKSVPEQESANLAASALQNAPEPERQPKTKQNEFNPDVLFNPQGFGAESPVGAEADAVFDMDELDELPPDMDDF